MEVDWTHNPRVSLCDRLGIRIKNLLFKQKAPLRGFQVNSRGHYDSELWDTNICFSKTCSHLFDFHSLFLFFLSVSLNRSHFMSWSCDDTIIKNHEYLQMNDLSNSLTHLFMSYGGRHSLSIISPTKKVKQMCGHVQFAPLAQFKYILVPC